MRRAAAILAGHFTICSLAFAAAQDLPYPGDPIPGAETASDTYIALRGSMTFDGKGAGVSVPTTPTATSLRPSHAIGGGASVALGARLPYGFRVEAEGLFHRKPVQSVNVGGTVTPGAGFVDTAAPMGNLIWAPEFDGIPVHPLIGAGAGMAYSHSRVTDPTQANTYLQHSGWHFAYQAMAGLEVPIAPGTSVTAMYRWMNTNNIPASCGIGGAAGLACKVRSVDQSIDLGLNLDLN